MDNRIIAICNLEPSCLGYIRFKELNNELVEKRRITLMNEKNNQEEQL